MIYVGPNLRSTNQASVKYQVLAQCYQNLQRYGSTVYQRITDYLGPQYDIQFGYYSQGFGLLYPNGTSYYDGYFGQGSLYIDLPYARKYDASFNCTKGFQIMNETTVLHSAAGLVTSVYTSAAFDRVGNYVERLISIGTNQFYPGLFVVLLLLLLLLL